MTKKLFQPRDVISIVKNAQKAWMTRWRDEHEITKYVHDTLDKHVMIAIAGFFGLEERYGRFEVKRDSDFIRDLGRKLEPLRDAVTRRIINAFDPNTVELTEEETEELTVYYKDMIRSNLRSQAGTLVYRHAESFVKKLMEEHGSALDEYLESQLGLAQLKAEAEENKK